MTKIVHLITSLGGGGTEHFLYQLLMQSPTAFSHRVLYLKKEGVYADRIRALHVPVEQAPSLLALPGWLRREKPDVLHTCLYRAHQYGRWAGHRADIPVIVSSQRAIDAWQKPWHVALDRWTLKWATAVLANSDAAKRLVEERRGSATTPEVIRINNGLEPHQRVKEDRWAAREAYGLPADALVGGSLMRLHPEKGADRIPEFAAALLSQRPDLHLIVGGTGPLEAELRAATSGKPWSNRLHWTGWEDQRQRFLSAIDFYWLISREESFPQTLLETSGLGIPWTAPDVGGTKELLATGVGALTYPASDPGRAPGTTLELIRLMSEMRAKSLRAIPTVCARFSIDKTIQTFYGTLDTLLYNENALNKGNSA